MGTDIERIMERLDMLQNDITYIKEHLVDVCR